MSELLVAAVVSEIRRRARALGFQHVGFSPAVPPERAAFFEQWLAEGKGATMTWLNRTRAKRQDPRLVLAGAKTIISVAQSYFTERLPDALRLDPSRGQIASYAWGRDYHEVLLARLEDLARAISELAPDAQSKCYVDTGPILEREYSERAGLGFVGKNTLLISPTMGSTFFLGEIITTLELPAEELTKPMPSCGSCRRCQEICPTHAFPTEYVLDSALCISYLTIELKGAIPRALRPKLGNHIFGCDDCQTVCPWNERFATKSEEDAYYARLERQVPKLADMARLSETGFKEMFAHSPVLRPGYAGFLRNVAVAIGNWPAAEALDAMEPLVGHKHALVREHAAWAVGQNADARAGALLREMLERETDEAVRAEITLALAERPNE